MSTLRFEERCQRQFLSHVSIEVMRLFSFICTILMEKSHSRIIVLTKKEKKCCKLFVFLDSNFLMVIVIGLVGYYKKFVQGFSRIVAQLIRLTQKDVKFKWDDECEQRFQALKTRLTSTLVFALPMGIDRFVIYSDASKQGLGCVLIKHGKVITYA